MEILLDTSMLKFKQSNENISWSKLPLCLIYYHGQIQTNSQILLSLGIVTRNKIVWKLVRGYCLCYRKTFSLLPGSTECTKIFLPKCAVHYLYHLKSNNIVSQRKTTNTEKQFYPRLISFNLKLSCT